jgi:hypothetical protein
MNERQSVFTTRWRKCMKGGTPREKNPVRCTIFRHRTSVWQLRGELRPPQPSFILRYDLKYIFDHCNILQSSHTERLSMPVPRLQDACCTVSKNTELKVNGISLKPEELENGSVCYRLQRQTCRRATYLSNDCAVEPWRAGVGIPGISSKGVCCT